MNLLHCRPGKSAVGQFIGSHKTVSYDPAALNDVLNIFIEKIMTNNPMLTVRYRRLIFIAGLAGFFIISPDKKTIAQTESDLIVMTETPQGNRYGYSSSGKNKPLALIFTRDIKSSLENQYTTIGNTLREAGFAVASIDVPCHGKDAEEGEPNGLVCWEHRISKERGDIFLPVLKQISDIVSDVENKSLGDTSFVVAIGVSRGGYIALRAAAFDSRINHVAVLCPVINLKSLAEFSRTPVRKKFYGFKPYFEQLSQKHIFLQIGNRDDRVDTKEALKFLAGVLKAGGEKPADITTILTPEKEHGPQYQDVASQWILTKFHDQERPAPIFNITQPLQ